MLLCARMVACLCGFVVVVVREGAGWAVCFAPRLLRIRMSLQHTAQPAPSLTTWSLLFTQHWSIFLVFVSVAVSLRVQR